MAPLNLARTPEELKELIEALHSARKVKLRNKARIQKVLTTINDDVRLINHDINVLNSLLTAQTTAQ